jgi:RND family efflux transporter MFP subunit
MVQKTASLAEPAVRRKPGSGRLLVFFGVFALILAVAVTAGVLPRLHRGRALAAAEIEVEKKAPVVKATPARLAAAMDGVELPGDLVALVEAPIFARADGFVKRRLVDLGYTVKSGQLMAELETPELDQQITQARATLSQSKSTLNEMQAALNLSRANLNLAKVTLDRWKRLTDAGIFSRQEGDEKEAALAVAEADTQRVEASLATARETVRANEANVRRLEELKQFASVTAPFDGIVTSRTTDIGSLINAGNGGPSKEMFRVAQIDVVRIFVNVPQSYVSLIHPGEMAELHVQELPGKVFSAEVTSIANALDPNSRAMLVICRVDNPRHLLYPGMYSQVKFPTPKATRALVIPGDALTLGKSGTRVAVVGPDHIVHFRTIAIGQDLGAELEVAAGLSAGELVVSNPTDAIRDGVAVELRSGSGQ